VRLWGGLLLVDNAVSLFAGVGGFDLALERNGVKVVASVEIDKKASAVLAKHFPHSQLFDDVCTVTGKDLINAGFNPTTGVIVGGFPCQDLSVAGKRAGLSGKRSGLFYEIVRLLDETKAQNFILENVPGLLSSNKGADMGAVVGALVDLGYSLAWRVLDAQHFGVPQRRRRVFIVGCLGDDWRTPAEILAIREGRIGYFEASQSERKEVASDASVGVGNFELYDFPAEPVSPTLNARRAHDTMAYGQSGFAKYTEGVTTLTATSHKRAEDNVVVHKG
jgi:DNA (cytosine-5)-methyltransferase 1